MFQKLKTFWFAFLYAYRKATGHNFEEFFQENTQKFSDTQKINFVVIFVLKLSNLANIQATFDLIGDSSFLDELKNLCKDIENKRFNITELMLGDGDTWIFPAHDEEGKLYHRILKKDFVRILKISGEKILDIIGVIDEFKSIDGKVYFLNRRHTLKDGSLFVETYITNEKNERTELAEWASMQSLYQLQGVDFIGVGRFKSPTSNRGLQTSYGVPLNFGCTEIEKKCFNDLRLLEEEFALSPNIIFADPLILKKRRDYIKRADNFSYGDIGYVSNDSWKIEERIFPIDTRGGTGSPYIDIYSPNIRFDEFKKKILEDFTIYEQQVGTDRGFLTPFDNGSAVTATEIRRANASTIALIDKIQNAIKQGVESTIEADAIFLNIDKSFYSLKFDFFDAFEDTDKQYERIKSAVDRGIAEKSDELQWIFPNLTDEQRQEKLEKAKAENQANSNFFVEKTQQVVKNQN